MRPVTIGSTVLLLALATPAAHAESFRPAPLIPDAGIDALNRTVARDVLDRDLFGDPYASVIVGNVDVYDRFPYLEARYFQVVSDPQWNRLLYGQTDRGLRAFESAPGYGDLSRPHGLSVDAQGRVYVADTGNDRVLVLQSRSEFDRMELDVVFAVDGLSRPYDVAVSDGGTPLDASDDLMYVANTGRNEILRFALAPSGAALTARLGELGSAEGSFAGPMAITVGRSDGKNDDQVYVADGHNGRIVQLTDTGSGLIWTRHLPHDMGLVTALDTDQWGHVYAAAPQAGVVQKLTPDLAPLASLREGIVRPRSFHVPFVTVRDHARGTVDRRGHGGGVVVEEWTDTSGLRLLDLGVDVRQVSVDEDLTVRFTLTDRATVTAEITDPSTQQVVAHHDAGTLTAGLRNLQFGSGDLRSNLAAGRYTLRLTARSTYGETLGKELTLEFSAQGVEVTETPRQIADLGPHPNPFNPSTDITFLVPEGPSQPFTAAVYDTRGRMVRQLGRGLAAPGARTVRWDGRDEAGQVVGSGVYLYRLDVGDQQFTGKLALVK